MLRNQRNFLFNVELIPYGWGHSESDGGGGDDFKEAIVFEETAELARSRGGAGASRERAAVSPDSSVVHVVRPASASDKGEDGGGGNGEKGDAMPMNAMSAALAAAAEKGRRPSNYSEIFDESLR